MASNIDAELPLWLQRMELEEWPTQLFKSDLLHCSLQVPEWWQAEGEPHQSELETSQLLRGDDFTEFLEFHFMATAEPDAKITNWVDTLIAVTGLPNEAANTDETVSTKLLEWDYLGEFAPLKEKWGVDEAHLYQGLLVYQTDRPELARLYLILSRRGSLAWKIALSYRSACPPGMPQVMIDSNDHIRAGASFGYLSFDD